MPEETMTNSTSGSPASTPNDPATGAGEAGTTSLMEVSDSGQSVGEGATGSQSVSEEGLQGSTDDIGGKSTSLRGLDVEKGRGSPADGASQKPGSWLRGL